MAGQAKGEGQFVGTLSDRVAVSTLSTTCLLNEMTMCKFMLDDGMLHSVHIINVSRVSNVCCVDSTVDARCIVHVVRVPKVCGMSVSCCALPAIDFIFMMVLAPCHHKHALSPPD